VASVYIRELRTILGFALVCHLSLGQRAGELIRQEWRRERMLELIEEAEDLESRERRLQAELDGYFIS